MAVIVGPTLPEPYFGRIEAVWDDLVAEFGIDRYVNPYPHVTLSALEDGVDVDRVEDAVRDVAADHDPVPVRTDGIGVFPQNAVWLPVARSPELAALHRDVDAALEDLGEAPVPYYDPSRWFPHVGLALQLDDELTGEIVTYLLEYDFEWEFPFETIAITAPPADGEEHELVAEIEL
jgi:2'-5' RNA ligase